jgi:predicted metalloprotease
MKRLGTAAAIAVAIAIATPEVSHAAAMTPDMRTQYEAAVEAVDQFWAANYSANFSGTYTTPNVLGIIDRPVQTRCGSMPADNASYCAGDDTLVFGNQFLGLASELGELFIYDVVAHEWGHAIQQRSGLGFTELGAECLSGAALSGAARAGALSIPDGAGSAIVPIAEEMGDPRPARGASDHGTGEQQANAFRRGWVEGPKSCFGGQLDRPPAAKPELPAEDVAPVKVPEPVKDAPDTAESPANTAPVIEPDLTAPQEDAQSVYVPDFGSLGGIS